MLIKSRLENVDERRMVRRTWGREFGVTSVPVRRVFLLGVHATDKKLQHRIGLEQQVSNVLIMPSSTAVAGGGQEGEHLPRSLPQL